MGNWLFYKQPKEYMNIYMSLPNGTLLPIGWPPTFEALKDVIQDTFKYRPKFCIFEDYTFDIRKKRVTIVNEDTYRAVVPRHNQVKPNDDKSTPATINVFHVFLVIPEEAIKLSSKLKKAHYG